MLDSLLEIEIAYSLLKTEEGTESKDAIDVHYEKLNSDINIVDKESQEFDLIETYVKNSHGSTHNHYDLSVLEVCIVHRTRLHLRVRKLS